MGRKVSAYEKNAGRTLELYSDDVWGKLVNKYKVDPIKAESLIQKEKLVLETGFLTREKPLVVAQWIALNNGILRFKR